MKKRIMSILLSLTMIAGSCLPSMGTVFAAGEEPQVQTVAAENGERRGNLNYFSNQGKLNEDAFVQLPMGAVEAKDWLKQQLYLQKNGLTGAIHDEYPLYGPDNGWRGGSGDVWEKGPYYLRGLVSLAWVLDDEELKDKAMEWINFILDNQRDNGFMGPLSDGDGSSNSWDWWPRMVILQVIRDYYEATELEGEPDARVMPFFEKYFRYQAERLHQKPLTDWAASRGGDNIEVLLWYYNRVYSALNPTETDWIIDLALLLAGQTKSQNSGLDWNTVFNDTTVREHVVNTTQAMKTPAVLSQLPDHAQDADSLKQGIFNMGIDHGRVDNLANADEAARENYPYRGAELCSVVESLLSNEMSIRITGESWLGDQMEQTAYNNLPAGYAPDYTGHNYFQAQNQVLATHGYHEFENDHGDSCSYGALTGFECCFPNMHMGWPKFVQSMWMATKDNGLAVVAYGPNTVTAKVADGKTAVFDEVTDYPFEDTIALHYSGDTAQFPLKLRLPAWCEEPVVTVNGDRADLSVQEKGFAVVNRQWEAGDQVVVTFPMEVRASTWYNNAQAVEYGPLIFALKVEEDWRIATDDEAREIKYEPVGEFDRKEVYPASDWNYALVLDEEDLQSSFEIIKQEDVALQPFTLSNAPITMKVKAQQVPQWKLKGNVVPEPPYSPIAEDESLQTEVELVPYGCTRIRITQMPTVGTPSEDGITERTMEDAKVYEEDGVKVTEFDNVVVPYAEDYILKVSYTGSGPMALNINEKYQETVEFGGSGTYTLENLNDIVPGTNQYFDFGYGKYNNLRFYGDAVEITKIEILPVELFTEPVIKSAVLSEDGTSVTLNTNIDRGAGFYTVRYGNESRNYTMTAENFFEKGATITGLTPGEEYYFQISMLVNGVEKTSNEIKAEKPGEGEKIPSFKDDFSNAEASKEKWTVYDPNDAVQFTDGSLQVGTSPNVKIMAGSGDQIWTDYAVETTLKGPENPQRDFGVMFRCTNVTGEGADSYQGYYVGIDAIGNGLNVGYANGSWNDIAKVPAFTYEPNKDYKLKILVCGNQFKVYVDGELAYELTDDKFAYGAVGLRSWNQPFEANSFQVRELTTEEKALFGGEQEPQEPQEPEAVAPEFIDDFEDAEASAQVWRLCGDQSKMHFIGGKLSMDSSNNVKAVTGEDGWRDYVAEVSITLSGDSTQNAGLMYRVSQVEDQGSDGYHGYFYGIGNNNDGTGYFILGYADGGWHQTRRSNLPAFENGKAYRLKVVVSGDRVAIFLDDELLTRFVDNRYSYGKIGLRSYEKPFSADDVTVRPFTEDDEAVFDGMSRYVDETFGSYKTIQLKFPKFSSTGKYKIEYGTESGKYTNEVYNLSHNVSWNGQSVSSDKLGLSLPENNKDYYLRLIGLNGNQETIISDEVKVHTGDKWDLTEEMEKLSDCLEEATQTDAQGCTEESVYRLEWAIQNAEKVSQEADSNLIDVRLAKNCLKVGMNELEKEQGEVEEADKTGLQFVYDLYKDKKESNYTPESWKAFAEALARAEELLADEKVSQQEVDEAAKALQDAAEALVSVGGGLTEEDLKEAVEAAEAAKEAAEKAQELAQAAKEEADRLAGEAAEAQKKAEEAWEKAQDMADASEEEKQEAIAQAEEATRQAEAAQKKAEEAQEALERAEAARDAALKAVESYQAEAEAIRSRLQAAKDEIAKAEEEARKAKEEAERLKKEAEESARLAEETLKKLQENSQKQETEDTVKKGDIYTVGKLKYQVTDVKKKTVTVTGAKKKGQKTVTIPATVKIHGESYKVTAVAKKAFYKNSSLRKVTIGKNVTEIGKNAFGNTRNLKSVVIKTKNLKKVGKGAFKGVHKKCVIRVPSKKAKAYKKLIKKSGIAKTVKVK